MSILYRPDIDGLRAIAVLLVVVFHAFPSLIPGGYLGVDVFFVISGYLISNIISNSTENNTFTFTDFYARRIKRIFPSLLTILTTSYLIGWFILLPDEFQQLGKHIASSIGFVQNFTLMNEAGYFDTSTEKKPLMHLWSLAVEEQFYLIYPLTYWIARKTGHPPLKLIALLAAASLISNVITNNTDASASFYLPHTRIWEILIGAALSFATKNTTPTNATHTTNGFALVGLICIFLPAFAISKIEIEPYYWNILATLGSAILIYIGPSSQIGATLLSSPAMTIIGKYSYPLYLWHWPIISLLVIIEGRNAPSIHFIVAVAASFILAILTGTLIENKIRFHKSKLIAPFLLVAGLLTGLIGYNTFIRDGLSFRMKTKLEQPNQMDALKQYPYLIKGCGLRNKEIERQVDACIHDARLPTQYALIGDSKAKSLAPGLMTQSQGWTLIGGTSKYGAPTPILSQDDLFLRNQPLTQETLDSVALNRNIRVVVLTMSTRGLYGLKNDETIEDLPTSTNGAAAHEGLNKALYLLSNAGKKIIITIDNPTLPDIKNCIQRSVDTATLQIKFNISSKGNCSIRLDRQLSLSQKYRSMISSLQNAHPKTVWVYDPTPILCDTNKGICEQTIDNHPLYSFTDHISVFASQEIAKQITKLIKEIDTPITNNQ